MRTPLSLACGYYCGLGLALALPAPCPQTVQLAVLGGLGCASAVALTALRPSPAWSVRLGPRLLLWLCLLLGFCSAPHPIPQQLPLPGVTRLRAQVEEVRYARSGQASARIRVLWGERIEDGSPLPRGTRLTTTPFAMPEGAIVTLLAKVRPAVAFRNPSPHPPLTAAHPSTGIARLISADAIRVVSHPWPARWLDGLRTHVRRRLVDTLAPDVEPVARAILLGDPDALEQGDAAAVRAAGLSHVFAVSGMHVSLLAGLSVWLLRRALFAVRWLDGYDVPRIAAALGIPLALSIAAFTGGAPSGWRASITTAIAWTVTACGRRPDPVAVCAAACLLFASLTPEDALRPAFVLSVAATAALLGQRGLPAGRGDALGSLRALGVLNLRTTLASAPVVWWVFGGVPLVGLLANLLLVPVGSLLLVSSCVHALVASLLPALAGCSAPVLAVVARGFLRGAGACGALDPALKLPVLSVAQGVALACAVAGLLLSASKPFRRCIILGALLLAALEEWRLRAVEQPRGELRVTFVDVGQGDAAIIDLPNGELMLIDAGGNPQGGPDPGARAILPLLAARRRAHVDVMVLTHPHPDHYGGLAAISAALPIRELWDSGQSAAEAELIDTSQKARALVERAADRGARVLGPEQLCDQTRRFGAAQVRLLAPCPHYDPGFDPNDNSLVVRIDFAGRSLIFAGDIEGHAEHSLVTGAARLRADVLKVPHHGSRTSSSELLLHAVQPSVAIVSAGAVNPFGHPHPEVIARLRRHVRRIVDLGEHGGCIVRVDAVGELTVDGAALR